jgi:cytochrome c oxidase cbb3-type subunit III
MRLVARATIRRVWVCVLAITAGSHIAGQAPAAPAQGGRGGGNVTSFPAQQRPPGDPGEIARGNTIYGIECRSCHGGDLRGGDIGGPNLLRSEVVLADQHGELIQPIIAGARQAQGMPSIKMSSEDANAVAAYIHSVLATARGQGAPPLGPPVVLNVLVGDPKAGEMYFAAKCSTCHSATGDLAAIGARIPDATELQTLWVSAGQGGRGGRGRLGGAGRRETSRRDPTAIVLLPSGQRVEGRLDRIDDFFVTITPPGGPARTFRREGDVPKVEVRDPLETHRNLLTMYTDKDIHDVTAYLATLK